MDRPKIVEKAYEFDGLHENHDVEKLMAFFREAGVEWDPRGDANAWCGVFVRCLCIVCGFEDPGPACHQARQFKNYGPECEPQAGCIVYGERHVAVMVDPDWDFGGKIIGGNQGDKVKEGGLDWYFSDPKFIMPVSLKDPVTEIAENLRNAELKKFSDAEIVEELYARFVKGV